MDYESLNALVTTALKAPVEFAPLKSDIISGSVTVTLPEMEMMIVHTSEFKLENIMHPVVVGQMPKFQNVMKWWIVGIRLMGYTPSQFRKILVAGHAKNTVTLQWFINQKAVEPTTIDGESDRTAA